MSHTVHATHPRRPRLMSPSPSAPRIEFVWIACISGPISRDVDEIRNVVLPSSRLSSLSSNLVRDRISLEAY